MRKCIYCKCSISEELPVDVCKRCGVGVWGERMFSAIVSGMDKEKQKGNMELGRVGERELGELRKNELMPEKFVEWGVIPAQQETTNSIQKIENSIDEENFEQLSDVEMDTFYLN